MFNQVKGCFDTKPVNFGRQRELDIAKGIIIIGMVFDHAFEILLEFIEPGASKDLVIEIYKYIVGGAIGAPVFIVCMGICFSYSKRKTANDMFRRAFKIAILALSLECVRRVIPGLLGYFVMGEAEIMDYAFLVFSVDILQFVALSLFIIALFKKLNLKPITMVIISIICSLVGQLLYGVSTGSFAGDIVAGFIWHSYDYTYFPLLNWLIFPVCGYVFGDFWLRLRDKDTFFRLITPICWVITILHYVAMMFIGDWYYRSGAYLDGLGILFAMFAFVGCFAMIGLGYYLSKWGGTVVNWLESMGIRVTSIYLIHWVIYCYMFVILFSVDCYLPLWSVALVPIAVLIVSNLLSWYLENAKASRRSSVQEVNN